MAHVSPLVVDELNAPKDVYQGFLKIGRTKFHELVTSGRFPAPIRIGDAPRWATSTIIDWIEQEARNAVLSRSTEKENVSLIPGDGRSTGEVRPSTRASKK